MGLRAVALAAVAVVCAAIVPDVPTGAFSSGAVALGAPRFVDETASAGVDHIYNGGFELKPSGSRLDWRIDSLEHVSVTRDSTIAHSGTASLRMQFDGKENIDFHHITQELVLPPGAYELAAYIRTRDLSTDEGISLWLASSEPGFALDVNTEALSGTADWKRVAKSFSIHSHSHLLTLQIRRRPSLRFDNQISGTAWIDSIVIKRDLQ